jgi:hypothetical protein
MSPQTLLSENDVERFTNETADAIRNAAVMAQLRADMAGAAPLRAAAAAGGPGIPQFPDFILGARIWARFAEEGSRNATAFGQFSGTLVELAGGSLIGQARQMIQSGQANGQVVNDLQKRLGPAAPAGHNTMQIGILSGIKIGAGIGGVTGVAIPLHDGSKVKWFSGAEASAGLVAEWEAAAVMVGAKLKFPHELKGEFYGAHVGLHVGAGLGFTIYFSADSHLKYEGFSYSVGVGAGGGVAIIAGFEIVTSD